VFTSSDPSLFRLQKPISPCFNSRGLVSHVVADDDKDYVVRRYALDEMTAVEFRRVRVRYLRLRIIDGSQLSDSDVL
jgi:hypothetical protein